MAAKGQSYADRSNRWEVLVTNAKPEVGAMPHIAEDLTALEGKLTEVRTLGSRQDDLRSQARELVSRIREALKEGEKIRGRLGASLRGKLGFDSEGLVKYGFKPRPNVTRRRAKAKAVSAAEKPAEKT